MAVTKKKAPVQKKATIDDVLDSVSELSTGIASLVEIMTKQSEAPVSNTVEEAPKVETPEEKAVTAAGPKRFNPINPEWEEKAEEILGDALDHCEVEHIRSGGTLFTLVIKNEKSNAGEEYIRMHGSDRRSKEIGNEGLDGVEQWCKLVKSNLNRPR